MSGTIYIRNDTDIRIQGFRDSRAAAGVYLNAADIHTWELRTSPDGGGSLVSSGNMAYVTGSNGEYVGGLDDSIVLTVGTTYWVHVILVELGVRGDWEDSFVARRRS